MPKMQFDIACQEYDENELTELTADLMAKAYFLLPKQERQGSKIVTIKIDYDHDIMTVVYRKKNELPNPPNVVYVARELLYA